MSSESESKSDYSSEESLSSDDDLEQEDNLELAGDIIKNYNIIYELGRGAYSIVWLAYNINTNNFVALKVQNPSEFKDGINEINFVKKLPKNPNVFNNLLDYFIETKNINGNKKKYLCSSWNLHYCNLDVLLRKGNIKLSYENVIKIMKQIITGIDILHNKFKVFHGDIKTDNILIKGINNRDQIIIDYYLKEDFNKQYKENVEVMIDTNKIQMKYK